MSVITSYSHDITGCMDDRVGAAGLTAALLSSAMARAEQARERVCAMYDDRALPLLRLPELSADMDASRQLAAFLKDGATDIVFLGTGGSSLGAQALVQLAGYRVPACEAALGARLHFFDNLDAATMAEGLAALPLKTTKAFIVSKSGGTPETMVQALCLMAVLGQAGLKPADHVAALTEPGDPAANPLLKLAQAHGLMLLDHDPKVGGRQRFSRPETTFPKTACLPSKYVFGTRLMKNWLPPVFGPEFAIEMVPRAFESPGANSSLIE